MHPAKQRQSHLRFYALVFAAVQALAGESIAEPAIAQEVQAVRMQAAALALRSASAEEWAKVARTFADLAARHPREPAVRSAHAEFLWDRDDRDGAIREWEAAERIAPRDARVLSQLADAHLATGRAKASAHYFHKACDAAPEDARLRHAAGHALFLFRHELVDEATSEACIVARALAHLAAATRLAPQHPEYARAYAETFYAVPQPDWPAALAAWEHYLAVTDKPDFARANLARVRLNMGQFGAARGELEKIQNTGFERLKSNLRRQIEAAEARLASPPSGARENLKSAH
jgi:tetratricopeptide (TPR) repeat protein